MQIKTYRTKFNGWGYILTIDGKVVAGNVGYATSILAEQAGLTKFRTTCW